MPPKRSPSPAKKVHGRSPARRGKSPARAKTPTRSQSPSKAGTRSPRRPSKPAPPPPGGGSETKFEFDSFQGAVGKTALLALAIQVILPMAMLLSVPSDGHALAFMVPGWSDGSFLWPLSILLFFSWGPLSLGNSSTYTLALLALVLAFVGACVFTATQA
mmetsp:Transcript_50805/g.101897  ORF Transcript_50805/g.101897 Transcript_50805/m.101897 type:complete len:160 (+) Transcript_50805:68-547(+)